MEHLLKLLAAIYGTDIGNSPDTYEFIRAEGMCAACKTVTHIEIDLQGFGDWGTCMQCSHGARLKDLWVSDYSPTGYMAQFY